MPTTKEYYTPMQPWDDCLCGRKWGNLHCPHCGYATVRATPSRNREATLPNGETIMNCVWNCRKCGQFFDTLARLSCTAPALSAGRPKKPKPADIPKAISVDNMSPEVLAKLEELRKKYQTEE